MTGSAPLRFSIRVGFFNFYILFPPEYECHKESKVEGLNCLRNQLTGDELLVWTIETFNMFYKKVVCSYPS